MLPHSVGRLFSDRLVCSWAKKKEDWVLLCAFFLLFVGGNSKNLIIGGGQFNG